MHLLTALVVIFQYVYLYARTTLYCCYLISVLLLILLSNLYILFLADFCSMHHVYVFYSLAFLVILFSILGFRFLCTMCTMFILK